MFAEKIFCGVLIFISFVVDQPGARVEACNIADWESCVGLDNLDDDFFLFFTELSSLNDTCRVMDTAFNCALKRDTISGCETEKQQRMVAALRGHKLVLDAICKTYRYAFEKIQPCLRENDVEEILSLSDCEDEAEDELSYNSECEHNEYVLECMKEMVFEATSECGKEDASLLIYLYRQYFLPSFEAFGCGEPSADTLGDILTRPTTTQPTTSTTPTTPSTTEPTAQATEDGVTTASKRFLNETTSSSLENVEADVGRSQNGASHSAEIIDHMLLLVGILFTFFR